MPAPQYINFDSSVSLSFLSPQVASFHRKLNSEFLLYTWPAPTASPDRQKALPAPRAPQSAAASALPSADATLHLSLPPSLLAALCHLPPGPWPLAVASSHACQKQLFSHCRALRSRASSEELKARKKLKNLEFCQHAASAKFEKAIPVRTRAPTHSDALTTLAPCVVPMVFGSPSSTPCRVSLQEHRLCVFNTFSHFKKMFTRSLM